MKNLHVVILAGGSGDRLWPLSSSERPKQLLPFDGSRTLLDLALDRAGLVAKAGNIHVVTCAQQEEAIRSLVGDRAVVLVEPAQKNTGPAILFALWKIKQQDQDAVVLVVPSDSYVDNHKQFADLVTQAAHVAERDNKLVLLGVVPMWPATGYGYIQYQVQKTLAQAYPVSSFHEKPDRIKAQEYLARGDMLWNTGMVVGSIKTFMQECAMVAPGLCESMQNYFQGIASYNVVPSISFDYAVLEKIIGACVLPVTFGWSDVGNLRTFITLSQQANNVQADLLELNAKNNVVQAFNKPVVCIGVDNLCIIETPHAIVVVHEESLEELRQASVLYKKKYGTLGMNV